MAGWLTKEDLHDEVSRFLWDSFGRQLQELVARIQLDIHSELLSFLESLGTEPQQVQPLLDEAGKRLRAEEPSVTEEGQSVDQDLAIVERPRSRPNTPPTAKVKLANPCMADMSLRDLAAATPSPPAAELPAPDCPSSALLPTPDGQLQPAPNHRSSALEPEASSTGARDSLLLPGAMDEDATAKEFTQQPDQELGNISFDNRDCRSESDSTPFGPLPSQQSVSRVSNFLRSKHSKRATERSSKTSSTRASFETGGCEVSDSAQVRPRPRPSRIQEFRGSQSTSAASQASGASSNRKTAASKAVSNVLSFFKKEKESTPETSPAKTTPETRKKEGFTWQRRTRTCERLEELEELEKAGKLGRVSGSWQLHQWTRPHICWRYVKYVVEGEFFDYCVGACLMCNAMVTGLQVNHMAGHVGDPVPDTYRILEILFCAIFSLEILLRLFVYRWRFFKVKGWQWNAFDTVVVGLQLIEEAATLLASAGAGDGFLDNLSVLRMLRLGRIVRLIRMVRLIPELKSMVYLIFASMWSFFWTTTLLIFFMYGIAVYFTELVAEHARKVHEDGPTQDDGVLMLQRDWGSIQRSVLSLYQAITGGRDWADLTEPLMDETSWLAVLVFTLYIAFATLVMLNLVTGVFVEGAQRIIKEDKDSELVKQMRKLFCNDFDRDSEISWREFEAQLDNRGMEEYFKAIDVNRTQAQELFCLLDTDESGVLSIEEFVRGCIRLRGPARSIDLAALMYDCARNFNNLTETTSRMLEDLSKLRTSPMLRQDSASDVANGDQSSQRSDGAKENKCLRLSRSKAVPAHLQQVDSVVSTSAPCDAESPRSAHSADLLT